MAVIHSSGLPIVQAASACVWRGDEVLLIRRASTLGKGRWSLPGGKCEAGEDALAAAHRELLEETGVMADLRLHVGTFDIDAGQVHFTINCYTGPWASGVPTPSTDADRAIWIDHRDIGSLELATNILDAVGRARRLMGS